MNQKTATLLVWFVITVVCLIGVFVVAVVQREALTAVSVVVSTILTFFAAQIWRLLPSKEKKDG